MVYQLHAQTIPLTHVITRIINDRRDIGPLGR
jgi:hypothetical protein